jgi:hypothetical protein
VPNSICRYCAHRKDDCEPAAREGGPILWCSRFKRLPATLAPQCEDGQSSESIDTREADHADD